MAIEEVDLVTKSYNIIFNKILSYEIAPSSPVSDFSLSRQIGISRTPIRQAILKLVSDGLVEKTDNGFAVISITESLINELYEAKKCIECSVVPLIIKKNDDFSFLRNIVEKEKECLDSGLVHDALEFDISFHRKLVDLSKNTLISQSYNVIYNRMRLINLLSLVSLDFKTPDTYLLIISALEKKDIALVVSILEEQHDKGRVQKLNALKKFGGVGMNNLFNFIATSIYDNKK